MMASAAAILSSTMESDKSERWRRWWTGVEGEEGVEDLEEGWWKKRLFIPFRGILELFLFNWASAWAFSCVNGLSVEMKGRGRGF